MSKATIGPCIVKVVAECEVLLVALESAEQF